MLRIVLVLLAFALAAPLRAQTMGDLQAVELTPERVEAVIAAYPPMRARLEEMDARFGSEGDADSVASQLQALAIAGGVPGVLDAAAVEVGFAGFMDWLGTTYAVLYAHAFARQPEMDSQMQQALAQIETSPGLSAAQKEQMKAAMLQSMGAVQAMRPSDQNVAAVAPYADEIEALLGE
jgi:hypothetical protein